MKASYHFHNLHFKKPGGTSRGVMTEKPTWYLQVWNEINPDIKGIGECSPLPGLSIDNLDRYEDMLKEVCNRINEPHSLFDTLTLFPSIQFGLEQALFDLMNDGQQVLIPSAFTEGKDSLTINGLIWMGSPEHMKEQIEDKLQQGFHCIKLKIGAIDFEEEIRLLQSIRSNFSKEQIELRVDANGAFSPADALNKLQRLAELDIHSIEQPIRQGQWREMAALCATTPIPIALDEELIGISDMDDKMLLLQTIKPQYIILKPSLLGGFKASDEWIELAEEENIGWWVTSALESNVGLNAIAQWTYTLNSPLPQGLGTGQLYINNIDSPLELRGEQLYFNPEKRFDLSFLSPHKA